MNKKFVNYHCHSSLSNTIIADSPSTVDDYIKRLKELNHTVYVSTEHGTSTGWARKYFECQKNGIKFVYGVEAYLEDSETVYHLMLMAKNMQGMAGINDCINYAVYNNYKYRRPRITIDTIKQFINPANVVCTTACVAGVIGRKNLVALKRLMEFFGENLWLEIGTSNTDKQKELNRTIVEINRVRPQHKIVVGLDSHYIYTHERVLRDSLVESKGIRYAEDEDESEWDMDFPDYDTIVERLRTQGILSEQQIIDSIENTNVIETFEDIKFDTSWHVPTLYPNLSIEERDKLLTKKAYERWIEFSKHVPEELHEKYREEIGKEIKEWIKCGFSDYLLTTSELVKRGVELGGVVTKSGRGSCSSFITTALFGLSTVDRVQAKLPLLQERFLNADRIIESHSAPDYD